MGLMVNVSKLNGETEQLCMAGDDSVAALKIALFDYIGVAPSRMHLLTQSGQLIEQGSLMELMGIQIGDLLEPEVEIVLGQTLSVLLVGARCLCCGTATRQKCLGCKCARYCSEACQKKDWRIHKKCCKGYVGREVVVAIEQYVPLPFPLM